MDFIEFWVPVISASRVHGNISSIVAQEEKLFFEQCAETFSLQKQAQANFYTLFGVAPQSVSRQTSATPKPKNEKANTALRKENLLFPHVYYSY
jgi:hypothetical protein